ncbi:MAG: UDP-N-acetylmuramate--L-alanine ligase [Candidatus Kuenenia sp.]|nr:UDP-N-acetylmuramate--L-alanine ligase [Candidatus Kuenenia hertensis]
MDNSLLHTTSVNDRLLNYKPLRGNRVYFIGIGGSGMSALARILVSEGCIVAGSDIRPSPLISSLEKIGVTVNSKQDGSMMPLETDMVVVSAAIQEGNPELKVARQLGIKVVKYSQILGSLMQGKRGIAISGTHGKTTTSAMVSTILKRAELDPTYVIGGEVPDIGGNAHLGRGNFFVAEACEYKSSFLDLVPHVGVITNIDEDHLDYYSNLEEIINAFGRFARLISEKGLLVVNDQDRNVAVAMKKANCKVETYSLRCSSHWHVKKILPAIQGINKFRVYKGNKIFDDFCLNIPGTHNILNALAAIAVCTFIGVDKEDIRTSLESFKGANRRFQIVGTKNDIIIIDDYAHHPTEIYVTLKAARKLYQARRIWCVYQPHQYSRTRHLLKKISESFYLADEVVLADIYESRDNDFEKTSVSSLKLYEEIRKTGVNIQYCPQLEHIVNLLHSNVKPGDVIITMGAGDIGKVAHELAEKLGNNT